MCSILNPSISTKTLKYLLEQNKIRESREIETFKMLQNIFSIVERFRFIKPFTEDGFPSFVMKKPITDFVEVLEADLLSKGKVWSLVAKNDKLRKMFVQIR
jgi:hypothetical protein